MPEQTVSSGKELARQRRAMLAQQGKHAVAKPGARSGAGTARMRPVPAPTVSVPEVAVRQESDRTVSEADSVEALCELVEVNPAALDGKAASVRQLCRERRQLLASQGKTALPKTANGSVSQARGRAAGGSSSAGGSGPQSGQAGREAARRRREDLCRNGRGDEPASRPSGRTRPVPGEAPPKVEVGTTLSGQSVTGTQVERKPQVTGNEPGTCRAITGTEYIGSEQFESFCAERPAPSPAKVGFSITSRDSRVSGTEVGRSVKVTGDEAGGCKSVTGTEYLGSEGFAEFCDGKGINPRPDKVAFGTSARKGLAVSGSDEARAGKVTGGEPGATRGITGSQYADAGAARLTINGPAKVALTHTLAGRSVSGTEVGRSVKVTGDEAGSCRAVSGTEYLTNEQFQSVCQTRPEPAPAKVGIDRTQGEQRITGNLVERTEKVTGNEPGVSQRVTGSQYGRARPSGTAPEKVASMTTLGGRPLTGSLAGHGPKLSGDERGGCLPVTGSEYYGQEQFAAYCPEMPAPGAAKVGFSVSPHGLPVSGSMLGRSGNVTGNEPGSGMPISGTPYAGREQMAGAAYGSVMSQRPSPRGASSPRYLAAADQPLPRAMHAYAEDRFETTAAQDFSIVTPARHAQDQRERITGNAFGAAGRITGPVNMAAGLVSGTPEFRYRDEGMPMQHFQLPQTMAPAPAEAPQPTRITGEGRDAGMRITGDDWARGGRVTGTEGRWAQGRNPTLRGEARMVNTGARANKDIERPEAPVGRVTGSSGNAGKGAMITVSGGARG